MTPMARKKVFGNLLERLVPILLLASLVLAFAVGVLWQKVSNLEGGKVSGVSGTGGDQPTGQPAAQGPIEGKLTEDQAKKIPAVSDQEHVRGEKNAKIAIIEYSDLECPFCKRFHPTMQQVMEEYKGKVKWVYRHFPLDELHSKADKEAEASECAFDLGGEQAFWAFIDKVYEVTPANNGLDPAELPKIATGVGVDEGKFKSCLDGGKFADKVEKMYQGGLGAGITGTPGSLVVNDKGGAWLIPGALPYESVKQIIDEAMKS